jgi:hypothetical protein
MAGQVARFARPFFVKKLAASGELLARPDELG